MFLYLVRYFIFKSNNFYSQVEGIIDLRHHRSISFENIKKKCIFMKQFDLQTETTSYTKNQTIFFLLLPSTLRKNK